jgi:hypothetical protein
MGREASGACWAGKPARTHERKRRRSKRWLELELTSPLHEFFTGGVEYDERLDLEILERFLRDFEAFLDALEVSREWGRGIEIKFRRLGKHRADGLFYPDRSVLVMDVGSCRSFAHEFGHLMDYGAGRGPDEPPLGVPVLSPGPEFEPVHRLLLERLDRAPAGDPRIAGRNGRLTRAYFASPSARGVRRPGRSRPSGSPRVTVSSGEPPCARPPRSARRIRSSSSPPWPRRRAGPSARSRC